MSNPSSLPDLSRLRELGDELLGELTSLIPNLTERTRGHVSLVDAIFKKLDCGGTIGSILDILGVAAPADAIQVAVVPKSGPDPDEPFDAVILPISPPRKAPAGPPAAARPTPAKASARKAPAKAATAKKAAKKATPAKKAPARKAAAPEARAAEAKAPTSVPGELAIPGYDSLAASQVIPRLESLSAAELEALRLHEIGGRGRRTILTRIAQIQGR